MGADLKSAPMRGLSEAFVEALWALARQEGEPNWWRDVLCHDDLLIAVRREGLDVYHRGQSVFQVKHVKGAVAANTHVKYLVRDRQGRVGLDDDSRFDHDPAKAVWSAYEGEATLADMIKAARNYSGAEKDGVHSLVRRARHNNVVDVEIALASPGTDDDVGGKASANRIDVATMAKAEGNRVSLTFHEAKLFANPDLRAKDTPSILAQLDRYEEAITARAEVLQEEYRRVAQGLVAIDAMRREVRENEGKTPPAQLAEAIHLAAKGTKIKVCTKPRLVIFAYDSAQVSDTRWEGHQKKIEGCDYEVYMTGDTKNANAFG